MTEEPGKSAAGEAGREAGSPEAGAPAGSASAADTPVAGRPAVEPPPDPDDPRAYVNRELSLLEFQRRVLEEAQDESNPLLQRIRFLAILGSNLDEFYMVRVAGLKQQVAAGVVDLPPDGMTPAQQLAAVRKFGAELMGQSRDHLENEMIPDLARSGIHILHYRDLNEKQRERVRAWFEENVFPVLTPLAFDPARPFPHISNLSLNLAVLVRDPAGSERFARVKVPATLPQLVPIKRSSGGVRRNGTVPFHHYFVWLGEVIEAHLDALFPGMEVREAHAFHVTRNGDILIQELEADDLLETIEEGVRARRFGTVTRIKVDPEMPAHILDILVRNLQVDRNDVYVLKPPLDMGGLNELYAIDRHDLKDPPFQSAIEADMDVKSEDGDIFAAVRARPRLLHHPFDSFQPVIDFLETSARDPDVLAIKMTLYRVGLNSPVVEALLEAMENRKQVAVLVELKARFDEESNIQWARALEREGVHVVYGLLGLKTHSKIALVIRREGERIRRYVHLATGNYNTVTAQLYTDLGCFFCDEEIAADVTDLFNYLTGYSAKASYRKLLVAPINLRERFTALIEREIARAERGEPAHLIFKTNALVDRPMIKLLYRASRAGVRCDLLVRGICCLRPEVPGLSENIRVTSIVGRFLEHSRIYWFKNGGEEEVYLGSADLMPRNINRRVEVLFPIEDPRMLRQLRDEVLAVYLADTVKSRRMCPDGSYERIRPPEGSEPFNAQEWLLRRKSAGVHGE